MANGFCNSEPIPKLIAAGRNPIKAIKAAILTGRVLTLIPSYMEASKLILLLNFYETLK
jgi:hypothetical protein